METFDSIAGLVKFVSKINTNNLLAFRGEKKDYGDTSLHPFVYRNEYIKNEHIIYRESQRFNDANFTNDVSTFDRLSRIQHYSAPTRLIDVSEDLLSAAYFAIAEKDDTDTSDAIIYIFEINKEK
ncbi:FRG domain-containing protein [Aeromonas jandaei]|uniref:FRG domain-containing protein n=1 Tax=Aeromonas jandaei TaxID=650 RepID=UPI003EC6FE3D